MLKQGKLGHGVAGTHCLGVAGEVLPSLGGGSPGQNIFCLSEKLFPNH